MYYAVNRLFFTEIKFYTYLISYKIVYLSFKDGRSVSLTIRMLTISYNFCEQRVYLGLILSAVKPI